jgi:hypothetical protein
MHFYWIKLEEIMEKMAKKFEPNKTLTASKEWLELSLESRLLKIITFLETDVLYQNIQVTDANKEGHVTLRIEDNIPSDERGLFLLSLEEKLKKLVDIGLTIWLEPVGDKSKLRNLRGVQIKT